MSIDDCEDMIENAPCGYLTLLANGRIHRINRTLCGWLDLEAAAVIGNRFSDYLNMGGRIYYETHIAPLLRMQGFFNEFAIDMVAADGKPVQVIANATERRGDDGKPEFIRIVVIKATDRRRYERELLQAREDATHLLQHEKKTAQLREQFIAVLGHDLRNPLASISAGARVVARRTSDDKSISVLAMMETTVMRMAGLIDDVLDFARGRLGGGVTLSREDAVDVTPLLDQVVDELIVSNPDRVINAEFHITESVKCDRTRLGQLVSNLIGNALTHGDPKQPVKVHAATEAGFFRLWVANGGDQIPDKAIEKLFEPFVRGDMRDSRQGLGLGLYIASQIAQAHGGRLTVSSSPDETRFTFEMPMAHRDT